MFEGQFRWLIISSFIINNSIFIFGKSCGHSQYFNDLAGGLLSYLRNQVTNLARISVTLWIGLSPNLLATAMFSISGHLIMWETSHQSRWNNMKGF
jgi:hypothetical protein